MWNSSLGIAVDGALLSPELGAVLDAAVEEKKQKGASDLELRHFVDDLAGALTDPIIVYPGGWEDTVPKWLREQIPLDRLLQMMEAKGKKIETGTDSEALAYISTASYIAPMGHQWTNIYTWLGPKVMKDSLMAPAITDKAFSEISPEKLSDEEKSMLEDLKGWIWRKRNARRPKGGKEAALEPSPLEPPAPPPKKGRRRAKKTKATIGAANGRLSKQWNGLVVDGELEDEWLERMNAIPGIKIDGSCAGHPGERADTPWVMYFRPFKDGVQEAEQAFQGLGIVKRIGGLHHEGWLIHVRAPVPRASMTDEDFSSWWESTIAVLESLGTDAPPDILRPPDFFNPPMGNFAPESGVRPHDINEAIRALEEGWVIRLPFKAGQGYLSRGVWFNASDVILGGGRTLGTQYYPPSEGWPEGILTAIQLFDAATVPEDYRDGPVDRQGNVPVSIMIDPWTVDWNP